MKQQKFVNIAPTEQGAVTVSSALGGAGQHNIGSGKFQPSLTKEYMLSKESLLEASRPSLHNNSHYVEAGKPDASISKGKVNQLSVQGQTSNNQSFHSTM